MPAVLDRLVDEVVADPTQSKAGNALRGVFERFRFCQRARLEGWMNDADAQEWLADLNLVLGRDCPEAVAYEPTADEVGQTVRRLVDHLLNGPEPSHYAAFALQKYDDPALLDDLIAIVERRMKDPRLDLLVKNCLYCIANNHSEENENQAIAFLERVAVEAASSVVRQTAEEDYLRYMRK